jgi:hypothetical protein
VNYTEYVNAMREAVKEASRVSRKSGITHMSRENLRQVTHFPMGAANANMAERAFTDAVNLQGHCLYITLR